LTESNCDCISETVPCTELCRSRAASVSWDWMFFSSDSSIWRLMSDFTSST